MMACGGGGGGNGNDEPGCAASTDRGFALNYLRGDVTMRVDDIELVAGGEIFHDQVPEVYLDYGPGTLSTTLEMTWLERDRPMRLYIYFQSDGVDWWADEVRTYDGSEDGEWIYYRGEFFRCPLGQYYSGDIQLTADASNTIAGSLSFENLWLRAFVGDEPPGAQQTEIEALVRPACEMYGRCDVLEPMNDCIYYWQLFSPAIREETFATVIGCIAGQECATLSTGYLQCWQDARPEPLPYHDEFLATCLARTEACYGQADPDCYAYDINSMIDLPYYSEALVADFSACVTEDCASLQLGFCMDVAGGRYGLDL
jgi:hypothetical protein